ncbi:MAG: tRNA pseudouridine(38-40) synthase TruA, partial [Candidatus Kuenenia stuttgartiensis]
MRNVRLTIEYEGTNYAGWQWQKNAISVQETLTHAVRTVTREEVEIHGAGRTDAGVHALGQVANFKTYSAIPAKQLLRAINFHLPQDITIKDVADMEESFHARYSATSKVYRYT